MKKLLILGHTGYIGQAFVAEAKRRDWTTYLPSRDQYDSYESLVALLSEGFDFLVNCAGYTGKPNVDVCEDRKADTIIGNVVLPQIVANACRAAGMSWGHVSSGCIYNGPSERFSWSEEDEPNFSFRNPPCSFYSGTKALAEELLADEPCYVWRLRIPFDHIDGSRNYLSKIQRYTRVYDNTNSISHRGDYAKACLDLFEMGAPIGIYNVVNPGYVTTRDVVSLIKKHLRVTKEFEFWADDTEFYSKGAKALRSNCVLDTSKLLKTGVHIRPVEEALDHALRNWTKHHG